MTIIAIATPAPRNAAVAIRPVIRRAQRDAFRFGGSRLRLRSACTFRAPSVHPARIVAYR